MQITATALFRGVQIQLNRMVDDSRILKENQEELSKLFTMISNAIKTQVLPVTINREDINTIVIANHSKQIKIVITATKIKETLEVSYLVNDTQDDEITSANQALVKFFKSI